MGKLVSIIIPVYNREAIVGDTLDSVLQQTYSSWECIVVDDGSSDRTLSVLERYQSKDTRIRVFRRPSDLPKGAPSCRNYGFEQAVGEFIQYFDSDDLMLPEMLSEKVDYLNQHPDAVFVVSKMGEFDERGIETLPKYKILSQNLLRDFLAYKVFFLTPGPLFKRAFLQKFNIKFDTRLERRQEREFFSRIILSDPSFGVIEKVHCLRRIHNSSIKSNFDTLNSLVQTRSKFDFYLRLSLNTKGKYSRQLFHSYGYSILKMGRFFIRNKEFLYFGKAVLLYVSLLFLTPFSKTIGDK